MRYGSVCSGIEAATVAWRPLGWEPVFFAEIEKFPCAVLAHHYPRVPNYGDITRFGEWPNVSIDLLVGGTPCQSFSVAGLRKGMADPRGNLALVFLAIADRFRPRWVVWENVPGVRSADGGRAFAAFLGGLAELGYGWAYRSLDAQYFGLAQRRVRVFVVAYLGDWRRAAAVLFERESLSGNPPPSRETRDKATPCPEGSADRCGIILPIKEVGKRYTSRIDGRHGHGVGRIGDPMYTLQASAQHAIAYSSPTVAHCLRTSSAYEDGKGRGVPIIYAGRSPRGIELRRLTPRECERLQGFSDDYTLVPYRGRPAADSPRYRALGNSMAVPVMQWIGRRIDMIEETFKEKRDSND